MTFLLRVELPDVPGSLGRLASAIGEAGGDIEAIEIVEKNPAELTAVDDVLLELPPGVMPDSVVSAVNHLDGVHVLWVSRYAAGGNLFLDLEVVEELTSDPKSAIQRLVELTPITFRVDWAAQVSSDGSVQHATATAPPHLSFIHLDRATRVASDGDANLVLCGVPIGDDVLLLGRHGGPEYLESELARLTHLISLALQISRD